MDSGSANASSTRAEKTDQGLGSARFLLLALVPACFAFNPVSGRALTETFGPATLTLVRWSLSGLAIGVFAFMRSGERWKAPFSHLLWLAFLAALGMGFCSVAAYVASRTTEATNIGLIYGCASAFIAAWEIVARRQSASASLIVGISVCLLGALLIITKGHPDAIASLHFNPGDLWATAGMMVFVGYTVAMRGAPARLTPMSQFAVMSVGASIAVLPFAASEIVSAGFPILDARAVPWIAVVVLATGIGAYLGYNVSLTLNGPVLTGAALTLTPAFAAVEAIALIGEKLRWYHAVAILLVVVGLVLISRGQRAR